MQPHPEPAAPRTYRHGADLWTRLAQGWDLMPPEIEPEPGWAAMMADSCRAVADVLHRLGELNPPSTAAQLAIWLNADNPRIDQEETNEHTPGDLSGRHRLRER